MANISRYDYSPRIVNKYYGTSYVSTKIFNAIQNDVIGFETVVIQESQRLDQVAGAVYGYSDYWWIIAAASGIGWGLQVGPGTVINIPTSIEEALSVL